MHNTSDSIPLSPSFFFHRCSCYTLPGQHLHGLEAVPLIMAEAALGLGASAVAFMGLTGQVLQGCHYICKFIDNVRDAQDDLHHYSTEITTFKSTVLGFQEVLRAIEPSAMIESSIQQALLALQSGSVAIEELKTPLRRYKHDGQRDWWKDIKVAQKRSQFAKCVGRLGEAKVNILLAQSRVNLSVFIYPQLSFKV
jgi:hypothetical protein